jgi:hypothetical protein
MERSKDMFLEYSESEYYALMERLERKEESLSFSSLKEFASSPKNFIKYKLKERKAPTDAVLEGSVCDALLCDYIKPQGLEFESKFSIVENSPSTDNQVKFCELIISGKSPEEAKKEANPRGDAQELYLSYKSFIDAQKSGKQCVSKEIYEKCLELVEVLKKSELVNSLLDSVLDVQVKQEWEFMGYKFKGFKDAEGKNLLIDFKKMADANPDKVEREIMQRKIYLQMAMYAQSFEGIPEVYLIVFDATGNFSVIKIDYSLISYGQREYEYLVTMFDKCVKERRWNESFNFFDVHQKTVYKPKWAKGFETDKED